MTKEQYAYLITGYDSSYDDNRGNWEDFAGVSESLEGISNSLLEKAKYSGLEDLKLVYVYKISEEISEEEYKSCRAKHQEFLAEKVKKAEEEHARKLNTEQDRQHKLDYANYLRLKEKFEQPK